MTEQGNGTTRFSVTFSNELVAEMDKRAATTKRSRNEWLARCVAYVLAELPTGATPEQRLALRKRWERQEI